MALILVLIFFIYFFILNSSFILNIIINDI